jgi:hypothetical protein
MLLLRTRGAAVDDGVWTARMDMYTEADEVLAALTDPAAIAAWAPVRFEVDGLAGERLRPGSRERVTGSLAGVKAAFDVEVDRADRAGFELVASGPVTFEVAYRFFEHDEGVTVEARVRMNRQGGLGAQLLTAAVGALLNAGALSSALRRIEASLACRAEASLDCPAEAELLAA